MDFSEYEKEGDKDSEFTDEAKSGITSTTHEIENKGCTKTKTKKSKRRKKPLEDFGVPGGLRLTPKLINQLTETEKLYQSNLYKFQIQELLGEISVTVNLKDKIDKWYIEFNKFMETLESSQTYRIDESDIWLGDVKLPLPQHVLPQKGSKGTFRWVKPDSIHQIGSWTSDLLVYKVSAFDIVVQMPRECLNNSDYLNHKYHVKRAMYLTYLAIQLKNRGDEIMFICPDGNPLKPALQILVNRKKFLKVRIYCIPHPELFKPSRFSPCQNNIRYEYFFKLSKLEDDPDYSTPNYNTTILTDIRMLDSNQYINRVLSKSENFRQAIKLLKVWLQQRSLNQGFGSFSNFIMTMFVCYLAEGKKINNNMSSYQIIRIVFVNLLQTDWTTKGITFSSEYDIQDWQLHYDVVFLDSTNQLNFTSDLSRFTYNRVKTEAKLGLHVLNTSKVSGFQSMFMDRVPFLLNFDHVLQVKVDDSLINRLQDDHRYKPLFLNHSAYFYPIGVFVIGQLMEKCLKQRIQILDVELTHFREWSLTSVASSQLRVIRFGVVTHRELASSLIVKCEAGDAIAVHEFKELWKEKSLLRRFRDGSMVETVTFEDCSGKDKHRVCFLMLQHILGTHLGLRIKDEDYLDNQLQRISEPEFEIVKFKTNNEEEPKKTKGKINGRREVHLPISLDEITNFASTSFDHLSKILRQLDSESLPLAITSVQGTSSVLRFSNFCPTPPQSFYSSQILTEEKETSSVIKKTSQDLPKLPKYIEPIGIIVQLEGSGKWPDNISAIERLKCAFLIRIGQLLKEQFGLCVQVHPHYLDVLKDGFVFRVKLTYFRELILLKQLRGEDGILRSRDTCKTEHLEKSTLYLPQLTSTLHSFNQQFGAFGKTCRLAKRWVASQLLLGNWANSSVDSNDCGFSEESIELIVAHLFLQYSPHLCYPNESQTGFLRFLYFLGYTDWKSTSIIVNFNEKLTKEDLTNIESEFVKKRETLPLLFIVTPEDKLGSVWTKHLSPVILHRTSVLARQAVLLLQNDFTNDDLEEHTKDWKRIFRPDVSNFSVLIWIKQEMNTRKMQGIELESKLQFKEYNQRNNELIPIVEFDPTQLYLNELRNAFCHLCLFLHDPFGGHYIAVVWKQNILQNLELKVSNIKSRVSGDLPKTVIANIDGVVNLFELMGKGIVERVEVINLSVP